MFIPKFTYAPRIITELTAIERLYGQVLGEKLIPSISLKLAQENQILATHHSTSIEGNPLSPLDVTNIILGDQIPVTKSEKEVKNYFSVLSRIFLLAKKHAPITTELTTSLHHQLMEGIEQKDLGKFREGHVFVGHRTRDELVVKHTPPYHTAKEISDALMELYAWALEDKQTHPLVQAGILHHRFVYIHPFFDGNGRLARVLTAYFLLLKNYAVAKYFILGDYYDVDRHLYSDTLHTADTGDLTEWLAYFLEGIDYSLKAALGRINEFKQKKMEEVTGEKRVLVTAREEDVLQIILEKKAIKMTDVQESLNVTRQQSHALIASLVKKGILQKFGKTKTSYYKLADKVS